MDNIDLSTMSVDVIAEEYLRLHDRFEELRTKSDQDAQHIHELKRSLATAQAAEAYLSQELEQFSNASCTSPSKSDNKLILELEEIRRKYNELQIEHDALQQDNDAKEEEIAALNLQLENNARKNDNGKTADKDAATSEYMERLNSLETEHFDLLHKLEEFQECGVRHTFAIADKEKTIEILRDQVSCLEENLRCKRDELEEKSQLIESAQLQLCEANSKIAMLTAAPENIDRKGNSLFAEVDDQRQAMKQLLAAQKKSYLQMKRTFNESEHEIRRLKRENIAMHTELQACSAIFCNADKTYQDKLNERIRQLMNQNENLESKLNWTQERLKDMAGEKSVLWLDSMLNFCKQETDEFKKQLHSVRIKKASLEEQLRNSQQDMARWRFESLKSRCVLIDRENLLHENKIKFKPINALEFNITDAQLQSARPRIVTFIEEELNQTPKITEPIVKITDNIDTVIKREIVPESIASDSLILLDNNDVMLKTEADRVEIKLEENASKEIGETTISASSLEPITSCINIEKPILAEGGIANNILRECKENICDSQRILQITPMKKRDVSIARDLACEQTDNQGRSILSKKRDIFAENSKKHVQFSSVQPIIHDISANVSSIDDSSCTDNTDGDLVAQGKENKPTLKQIRPKSKVIVRRIIVGMKQEKN